MKTVNAANFTFEKLKKTSERSSERKCSKCCYLTWSIHFATPTTSNRKFNIVTTANFLLQKIWERKTFTEAVLSV